MGLSTGPAHEATHLSLKRNTIESFDSYIGKCRIRRLPIYIVYPNRFDM